MKKILLLLFVCCASVVCGFPVEVSQLSVNSIPLVDQLPSNSVQRIFQDKDGFLWFGTLDGLCRYDAYRLLTIRSNVENPNLLTNNEITCIAEDEQGFLWIGTKKGLNLIDKKSYHVSCLDMPELNDSEIKALTVASDGSVWVGTQRQVIKFSSDRSVCKKYDSSLPISSVNSIYEDKSGNIWISLWNNGLHLFDRGKDKFVSLPRLGTENNPFKLYQDKEEWIWICSWGNGIYLLNKSEDGSWSYSRPDIVEASMPKGESRFFSITQDDKYGYLWIVSMSGLYAFETGADGSLKEIDVSGLLKETNGIFSEIIKDKKGNLWIGTFSEGVFSINFEKSVIQNYPMSEIKKRTGITPNITALYEDKNGNLWFNQNRYGLGFLDVDKNRIALYQDFPGIKDLKGLDRISCIAGFRSLPDEVWVGSFDEPFIYSMDMDSHVVRLLKTIDLTEIDRQSGSPLLFFEDRKNNIWIVSTDRKLFIKFYNSPQIEQLDCPISSSITGITEDTKGTVWISTATSGIYQINVFGNQADKMQIKHYDRESCALTSDNIEAIHGDVNGHVWIGTKEGNVIVYDVLEDVFADMSSTFNVINEGILNIIADEYGHIWILTNKRVAEYNPSNKAFREYSITDGVLVNSFLKDSYYKNNRSEILFGGNNGISVFSSSDKLSASPTDIKVLMTDVKIDNKSVLDDNVNSGFNIGEQTLRFEPGDKNIEIDFSSLDYTFPDKVQYAYRMKGIDDDWVYAKKNRQFAIYNRLKKGTHTFLLKATDENGLWSPNVTQLKIYKRPAFYETWWAYSIYFIVFVLAIYFTSRTIKNRIRLRNELKIAQIEKEKSEELTQSKLRYFTNISHDFMTPLTIVSCLIDDAEMMYKGKISQFDTMRSNIKRLQRLLQQVLDFRKVESGNMKLKLSYGDIVVFVRDICSTHFELIMQKKNIKFSFLTTQNQIQAFFDPDKIDKIMFNLLSNAYKYTPENGEIKVELELQNNRLLVIKVSDTGIGISKKEQKNIFTRFYTDDEGRTKGSNGIGLSLTKDLLELHHGAIRVDSEVDKGTCFTIAFPIDKDSYNAIEINNSDQLGMIDTEPEIDRTPEEDAENRKEEKKDERSEHGDINLLLVEDNEDLLNVVSNILSKHYHVLTAVNGVEALDVVKEHNIDIVISDVMMPEMDGLEVVRRLRSNLETSHIPILLLTAKNSTEDRVECYNAGADGYISKPFELKVLEARVNNLIAHKKDRQKEFKSNVDINISTLEYPTFDEQFLNNAVKIIEDELAESDLDVNAFAEKLNMSKSSLYRKIKTMTGLPPNEFIRNIRLKHACQMLKNQSVSISEVAYSVGFSDPKYFTLCFKNEFNMTPREYQKSVMNQES